MTRLKLRTQLLIASFLIICALTGSLVLLVHFTVRAQIYEQVREGTNASLRAFENVERERESQLSRIAALLAELPTLKALMSTDHRLTIQDASEPLWKLAGSDLFLLSDPDGNIMGLHVTPPGTPPSEAAAKELLDGGAASSWWYDNGQLYWVFIRPITVGAGENARELGLLAVGFRVDSAVAEQLSMVSNSQIALVSGSDVIASTLPHEQELELRRRISVRNSQPHTEELTLGANAYQSASILIHDGPPAPIRCYVLLSLDPSNRFIQQLNRKIFILGISAVVLTGLLLSFVARRITLPLDNLLSGVRALAQGDYKYSITPRGSSEVAELTEVFSKMRGELLALQQRQIAAERIAALERAASSISHDLRHYLAAVVANAEFLYEADKLKLDRTEIYEEIKMASDQMTDLLDSLRELGRAEGTISAVPASMERTVRRAIESVVARPEFRTRAVFVSTSGEMVGVFDPAKIERAFFNLVLNACEATTNRRGKIEVDIRASDVSFEIRVADNGTGIPMSIREALFDPFVSYGKSGGTGLGLTIVNKTIHDHDGTVAVEQTSDEGTVFLVRLPRSCKPENTAPQQVRS